MMQPSRIAKRFLIPVLLAATLVVAVQVVLAAPPDTGFSVAPDPPVCGQTAAFTSSASDPDGDLITLVEWDFDYAGTFTADATTGSSVDHVFTTPGSHTVAQRVTTAADPAIVSAPQTFTVAANPPAAPTITAPVGPVQPGVAVPFSASTVAGATYAWDFDYDGTNFTADAAGQSVNHPFTTSGPHTVGLRATTACGTSATATASVTVDNANPTASFTMTANGGPVTLVNPGTPVTFTATASDPNGDTVTYAWDLDGNAATDFTDGATSPVVKTYTPFATAKTVVARLRVTDGQGGQVIIEHPLIVNKAPFGAFTISPEPSLIGENVTFDASSSFDFENSITKYEWDFNYAGSAAAFTADATGAATSHAFATAGAHPVALRVTDEDGGVTVAPRTATVQVTRPNAGVTFSPENPLPGEAVTLTSTSTPSTSASTAALVATQWDLDYNPIADFTLDAAGGSIVTSFATAGSHTVAVKVTETGGGFAVAAATIVVNAPPHASFTVAPSKPVEGRQVTFASTASDPDGPLAKQEWDLDNDGQFDDGAGAVASTSKLKKGTRTVRLRVTDSKGATSVAGVPVKVAPKPLRNPSDIQSTVSGYRKDWGILLTSLTVQVPSRTSVSVTCKGSGCPRGTFRKHSKKKPALLTFKKVKGSLHAGARINIIFTRPGYITGWDTITVRGGNRRTLLREGCKPRGAKKQKHCPKG